MKEERKKQLTVSSKSRNKKSNDDKKMIKLPVIVRSLHVLFHRLVCVNLEVGAAKSEKDTKTIHSHGFCHFNWKICRA